VSNALTTLTHKLATRFDMGDGAELIGTLKQTVFKGQVTDAQMTALLLVADQYALNPWTKEIYAFPDKNNGIIPVVGVDGWSRIINSHPQFDGMTFRQDDESCTCIMHRKDRSHPVEVTEYMSECKRSNVGPWMSHPRRMLRHKAMIQCARLAFGFSGIYDQDEAERIAESEVTPQNIRAARNPNQAAEQNAPDGLAEFEAQHLPKLQEAAKNGPDALAAAFQELPKGAHKAAFWQKHQAELKAAANSATVIDAEAKEVQ
jgi:hypothetical protein